MIQTGGPGQYYYYIYNMIIFIVKQILKLREIVLCYLENYLYF